MKYSILFIYLFFVSFLLPKDYVLDTKKSSILWLGKKLADQHSGAISIRSGNVKIHKKNYTGRIIIHMTSIVCTDIKDKKYNKKLVDHLKSDDFFAVKKYPTAILEITSGKKLQKNMHSLKGKLTIRDKTNPIKFNAVIDITKKSFVAKGKLIVDRSKFGVNYNSGSFFKNLGDKLIYDNFDLDFTIYSK